MKNKPVVVFNRRDSDGNGFWDPLIALLEDLCEPADFEVATTLDEILPAVTRHLEAV